MPLYQLKADSSQYLKFQEKNKKYTLLMIYFLDLLHYSESLDTVTSYYEQV